MRNFVDTSRDLIDSPSAGDGDHADDFADLFGPLSPKEKLTLLAVSLVEDPFATTRMEDGENPFGGASALARYERASAVYLAACREIEQDDDRQEILRLIAAYWLRKARAFWID